MCVEEWNDRHREMRAARAVAVAFRTDLKHGTISTYVNHGCRCEACKAAQAEANRGRPSRARRTTGGTR